MMRWIDLPPLWLGLFVAAAWQVGARLDFGLTFGPVWADLAGGLLVGGGVLAMAMAVVEMRRARTTVIPHRKPDRLVTSGIFARSRNPIYLGDSMVLAGLILYWNAVLALPLVPVFVWLIERRFVIPEEDRLRRTFRADFARYAARVRRWL